MVRISSMDARFFLLFYLLHTCFSLLATAANNTLESNVRIEDGETLVSANKLFELRFFSPEEDYYYGRYVGIWYHGNITDNRAVWVANREKPLKDGTGILTMRADGNFVISYSNGTDVWSTNVSSQSKRSIAVLEDTGNLVVREVSSEAVLWESFDHPCDTLLPGMKIGINLRTRSTRMLTAWKNEHDPSPGIYAFGIDPRDTNQFFIWRGSFPYWRVIWWNGTSFQVPSEATPRVNYRALRRSQGLAKRALNQNNAVGYRSSQRINASVVRTHDEVYFSLFSSPGMLRTWLALETSGLLWESVESAEGGEANDTWTVKPEQRRCSTDGVCGPNSSCNEEEEPMCKCLPGYKPLSTADWDSGNWMDGCTSELSLECGDKDGYLTLKRVKLPEFSGTSYEADNATMCRKGCDDMDCKCRAYAWREGDCCRRCYYWYVESAKVVEEDADEDGSDQIQPEVNFRVSASVLSDNGRRCSNCGTNIIPYPLSTGPNCGDPDYRSFHCNNSIGQLSFLAPDGSSYAVSGISPENRTFFIKPEGLDLCWAGSSKRRDIHLNSRLPFRVTRNNTVLLLNCSSTPKNLPSLNCSATDPCHSYIQEGRAPCFYSAECCSYIAGGTNSSTLHEIGILDSGCGSYVSIVNLDTSVDLWEWKERVQIEWDAPPEPVCDSEDDCGAWPNSSCLASKAEVGMKRCLCNDNFRWDRFHMNCAGEGGGRGPNGNKKLFVILIATAAPGIILSAAIIYCLWEKNRRRGKQKNRHDTLRHFGTSFRFNQLLEVTNRKGNIDLPFIDFECLVEATDNFSNANKLGKGGFGPVYKGTLSGGQEIAVKRLSKSSGQGAEEFENEVVLIAKLQHRNLVRMLGYCIEGSEKMLVYEYMPNKSLDFFLFDATRRLMLDWEKRINIIMGITRGILYLHQDSRLRIIHRDLKTSNILLDKDMSPKISDFGMARIFGGNQTQENTNRVVGTYGYISPEYAANGLFSVKSDVYSFGIIILEIIAGKKNAEFSHDKNASSLTAYAWQLWKDERGLELMDPSLRETCDASQALKCIHLGLLCVQENATDRPTMSSVLVMLESETASLPAPNQPAFFRGCFPAPPARSCPGRIPSCSNNMVTISTMEGR